MIRTQNKINWLQYAYYIVLLLVMASWTNQFSSPPMVMRLAFLAALFVVPIFSNISLLPAVLSCFFIVSANGFSYSYLPSMYYIYCIPIILCLVFVLRKRHRCFAVPNILVVLLVYSLVVNFISSGIVQNLSYCCFIVIAFVAFADTELEVDYKTLAVFFALASVVLSLYFFIFGSEFTNLYSASEGLERTGWNDSNYFSTTIGFSALTSLAMLLTTKNNFLEKILFIFNIIATPIVMIMVASRGGLLSLAAGTCVLLFLSKIKLRYKLLVSILIVFFLIYLFNNDYFQLLQYRIEMDETGGSGRIDIWKMKLHEFGKSSPLVWLFGMGFQKGIWLGGNANNYACFHNDFISYLVCYGIVGLVLFLLFLTYPIRHSNKKNNLFPVILTLVSYLIVTGLTLEPLSQGILTYFSYYYFILLLMQQSKIHVELLE